MTTDERLMEVAKLRLRFRMNNRLRLESLAMLSRIFREHQEPIADELLSSIVFAVPEELMGEAHGTFESTEVLITKKTPTNPNPPPHPKNPLYASSEIGGNPPPRPPRSPNNPPPRPPKST
jgi:hypothetical protein